MNEIYFFYILTAILCLLCVIFMIITFKKSEQISNLTKSLNEFENINIEQKIRLENLLEKFNESGAQNEILSQKVERKNLESSALEAEISKLQAKISSLQTMIDERTKSEIEQIKNFELTKKSLSTEFENLANKIFKERSESFNKESKDTLELMLNPLKEQILGFQKRTNEIHDKAQESSINLQNELKKVLEVGLGMSREANNLTNALKGNNKIAGNWGETQLEVSLQAAGLVKNVHYISQANFKNESGARLIPDFILKLPEGKNLIIDSKVSLLAYENAISSKSQSEAFVALSEHVKSVRAHIDELSKKDYSAISELASPDFVLMFMPLEAAYIEAMKFDTELFSYAYEKKVILVSHTTLMPILRTIANLWRIEQGNAEAMQIAQSAGDIYNKICVVAENLNRLGATLNTAGRQYNQVVTSLAGRQGVFGKVERFKQISQKATQTMPEVNQIEPEIETSKLENLIITNVENGD